MSSARMGHEAMRLILPGFDEAVRKGIEQTRPSKPGAVPLIHETGLHDVPDLDAYIIRYFEELVWRKPESSTAASANVENVLATMPGEDELRGQLLATFMAPMQSLVAQLNAVRGSLLA